MADEPAQDPAIPQDSPEESAPQPQGDETRADADSDVNWEQRYRDTQSEFTRKSQELAQYEQMFQALQDPEQAPEVLRHFNYELAGDDEQEDQADEEFVDPYDELRQEVEALKQERAQEQEGIQQQALQEAEFGYIDQEIGQLEQQTGRQLSEAEANTLGTLALQMRNEQGFPDVKGAYESLDGILTERQKAYVEGKRQAARAPEGVPGVDKVNLTDTDARQAALANEISRVSDVDTEG